MFEYSISHIKALTRSIEEAQPEERIDIERAIKTLNEKDRQFIQYVLDGHPVYNAACKIGEPANSDRRFHRICDEISMFLGGYAL